MSSFTGQLRSNEIFASLYNLIISQEVFADNIGNHQTLVDKARVDGGLFGDTKLFYSTDVLKSAAWGNDAEAANLLSIHRPSAPEVQAIHLDVFRQIALTVDEYLSKRAWGTSDAFSSFNSVMTGWINETKKVYDGTTYNVFVGTAKSSEAKQNKTITLSGTNDGQVIAEAIANLISELGDYSRDFNDYKQLRSYNPNDLKFIWNAKYVNKIKKVDLPTIFHKDGLVDKLDEDSLPARYFGTVNGAITAANNDGTLRSVYEKDYTKSGVTTHCFAGDLIPSGIAIDAGDSYTEDAKVICKVCVKLPPYMSSFSVSTSFYNPKSLTENKYLTFGHNTIEYLKGYPFITIKQA